MNVEISAVDSVSVFSIGGCNVTAIAVPSVTSPRHKRFRDVQLCGTLVSSVGVDMPRLCYVIQGPTIPGKFDRVKALQLGVPSGPLCGRLVKGESITTPDGKVVRPEDCVGPAQKGRVRVLGPINESLDLYCARHCE